MLAFTLWHVALSISRFDALLHRNAKPATVTAHGGTIDTTPAVVHVLLGMVHFAAVLLRPYPVRYPLVNQETNAPD
jgi:hypothetical protein